MKHRSTLVFVASVLSLLPFVACDDGNNDASKDGGSDGTTGQGDGSVLPADDAGLPDNYVPAPDSGQDAGQDAGPPTTATVIVTKGGAPDVGVTVVFEDAAGTLVGTVVTGADGKATNTVAAGSQLTVALGAAGSRQLITYLGVKPGDVINVAERITRDLSITQTVFGGGGGDTIVAGNLNCSTNALSTGSVVGISLTPDCISGATFPILSQLYQGGNYYSFKKANALAASGTTNVSGLSAWTLGTAFTMDVSNAPNGGNANAVLGQIANNQSYATSPDNAFSLMAGAGTANFTTATGYPDAFQGEVQFTSFIAGGYSQTTTFAKRIASGVATQALDLSAGLLPGLTAPVTSQASARPVISWTATASLAGTDSGVVDISFLQPVDGGGNENVEWTFIVPPGTLSVTAPQLPAQLAAFQPSAASVLGTPNVAFFESDLIASYDVVRQQAGAFGLTRVPVGSFSNIQSPALPAPGTLRITAVTPGGG